VAADAAGDCTAGSPNVLEESLKRAEALCRWLGKEERNDLAGNDLSPTGRRGAGGDTKASVARLTDWLRQAPDVEAVMAVGFAVLPKEKR
jgi:hypothetical protein